MKPTLITAGVLSLTASLYAKTPIQPQAQLGIVQAPAAGSSVLALEEVPAAVKHAAMVAMNSSASEANFVAAAIDFDEIEAVYELKGLTADNRQIEVDVNSQAKVLEIELEVARNEVPAAVIAILNALLPNFQQSEEEPAVERSIRPAANGLLEEWYEFSGVSYDVEVRSDGRALLIEPA